MKQIALVAMFLLAGLYASFATESPKIRAFERGSWQRLLKAHSGRPTLVHFWGVTCGPCKVELPQLGDFMKRNPSVDVVTIDADLVPNSDAAVLAMLDGAGLSTAENWMFNDGFPERLRYEIDSTWQGDIPRTLLISAKGEMATIEGSAEPSALQNWTDAQAKSAK